MKLKENESRARSIRMRERLNIEDKIFRDELNRKLVRVCKICLKQDCDNIQKCFELNFNNYNFIYVDEEMISLGDYL
jgi:hypothetical protein